MPFLGQEPLVGGYHVLDNITASATNTYNLLLGGVAFTPESANHLLVSLNGVIQKPSSAFSVSGSQITFIPSSGTLSNTDSIDFILALGNVLNVGTPSDNTISTAKIVDNAVTSAKLAGSAIGTTQIADDSITLAKANDNFYKTGTFSILFRDGTGASGNDSQTFTNLPYTKIGDLVSIYVFAQDITTSGMGSTSDLYLH